MTPKLNTINSDNYNAQETEWIEKKRLADLKDLDVTNQQNEAIQKQIELYKTDIDSRLKNLQAKSKNNVFDNEDVKAYVEQIKTLKENLNPENFQDTKNQISSAFKGANSTVRELNTEITKTHGIFGDLIHDGTEMLK